MSDIKPDENLQDTTEDALRRMAGRVLELECEVDSLKRKNETLREEAKLQEQFVIECTELISESYDSDDAAEAIVLNYLRDVNTFAGIIARLTSGYR